MLWKTVEWKINNERKLCPLSFTIVNLIYFPSEIFLSVFLNIDSDSLISFKLINTKNWTSAKIFSKWANKTFIIRTASRQFMMSTNDDNNRNKAFLIEWNFKCSSCVFTALLVIHTKNLCLWGWWYSKNCWCALKMLN